MSEWKWSCIKNFIIIFMLFIFGLCLLFKKLKTCPDFWKKKEYLVSEIFPIGAFFCVLQIKCLPKSLYFKKHPQGLLPWKIPGYAPDVNQQSIITANVYLIKANNRNSRRCSGVFIVNFEHIPHLSSVFLLLTLNK